jgi:hypothetical protein
LELIERKFGLFSIFVCVAGDQAARPSTTDRSRPAPRTDRSTIADVVWPGNDLSQYGTGAIAAAYRRRLSTRAAAVTPAKQEGFAAKSRHLRTARARGNL